MVTWPVLVGLGKKGKFETGLFWQV